MCLTSRNGLLVIMVQRMVVKIKSINFNEHAVTLFLYFLLEIESTTLLHTCLYDLIEATSVGEVLKQVNICDVDSLCRKYLHDFVRIVHKCQQKKQKCEDQEYEVLL